MSHIADKLRAEAGDFTLHFPDPPEGKRFARTTCPFCGKDRAWIDHLGGWFKCPHAECGKEVTSNPESWVTGRFRPQIEHAAQKVSYDYAYAKGTWVSVPEAREVAEDLVINYANGRIGDANSAGLLFEWEADVDGDQNELDRFVLAALNADLRNYANKKRRKARSEPRPWWLYEEEGDPIEDGRPPGYSPDVARTGPKARHKAVRETEYGDLRDYPLLAEKYADRQAVPDTELARLHGVSLRTIRRRIAAETGRYKDDHRLAA